MVACSRPESSAEVDELDTSGQAIAGVACTPEPPELGPSSIVACSDGEESGGLVYTSLYRVGRNAADTAFSEVAQTFRVSAGGIATLKVRLMLRVLRPLMPGDNSSLYVDLREVKAAGIPDEAQNLARGIVLVRTLSRIFPSETTVALGPVGGGPLQFDTGKTYALVLHVSKPAAGDAYVGVSSHQAANSYPQGTALRRTGTTSVPGQYGERAYSASIGDNDLSFAVSLAWSCVDGETYCGGACVQTASDPAHCGGCGIGCEEAFACVAGSCAPLELTSLALNTGTLVPAFDPDVTSYAVDVPVWAQTLQVTAAANDAGEQVTANGVPILDGGPAEVPLPNLGSNAVVLEVTGSGGGARAYTLDVRRGAGMDYLKAGNSGESDTFGYALAVSGDTLVLGAYGEDSSTTGVNGTPDELAADPGAAYVFVRAGSTWTQQAFLKASNAGAGDFFGRSVAISGDTVVVGAVGEDSTTTGVNSTPNELTSASGAAYVFVRTGTTWSEQAYLKASNAGKWDNFGASVGVWGDTVVVGALQEGSSTNTVNSVPNDSASGAGAAYVFVRSGTTWTQQAYLKPLNPGAGDWFGQSVAVAGDTVVVGAPREGSSTTAVNSTPNESAPAAGAAYVFARAGATWSQQAYLKAHNAGGADWFGQAVAVSGDTLIVGAPQEDSDTATVDGPSNESAINAGAAYVFVRVGDVWNQQAFLKASNTGADDRFGHSVSLSDDLAAFGAYSEDSGTAGVNSGTDETLSSPGAAYVFERTGSAWAQRATLKATNPGANDSFGYAVGISRDTVVVGASYEASSSTGVNSTPNDSAWGAGAAYTYRVCPSTSVLVGGVCVRPAGTSCHGVAQASDSAPSGPYVVDHTGGDTSDALRVYCEMDLDDGGWTLVLVQNDAVMRTILQETRSLTSPNDPGAQIGIHALLADATEIKYTDLSGTPFLDAYLDGAAYSAALRSDVSKAVPVTYKGGPLAGTQRYAEVQRLFHWGHRNNMPTNDGQTTGIQDVYADNMTHACWEDVNAKDRAFAGNHMPSSTSASFCPGTAVPYPYPAASTRGGSFKYRKYVR